MARRVIASIYVDNQDKVNYPLGYIMRNLCMVDAVYLFGSDELNSALLRNTPPPRPCLER